KLDGGTPNRRFALRNGRVERWRDYRVPQIGGFAIKSSLRACPDSGNPSKTKDRHGNASAEKDESPAQCTSSKVCRRHKFPHRLPADPTISAVQAKRWKWRPRALAAKSATRRRVARAPPARTTTPG